jgi:hypothetical protein
MTTVVIALLLPRYLSFRHRLARFNDIQHQPRLNTRPLVSVRLSSHFYLEKRINAGGLNVDPRQAWLASKST